MVVSNWMTFELDLEGLIYSRAASRTSKASRRVLNS